MLIKFLNAKDKAFFEDPKKITKAFSPMVAKKLQSRLDDLDAAQTLEDMRHTPGHWEELKRDRVGQFSAQLQGGFRLIVKPQKDPPPTKPDGGLDWRAVDSLFMIEIVDYHD